MDRQCLDRFVESILPLHGLYRNFLQKTLPIHGELFAFECGSFYGGEMSCFVSIAAKPGVCIPFMTHDSPHRQDTWKP